MQLNLSKMPIWSSEGSLERHKFHRDKTEKTMTFIASKGK